MIIETSTVKKLKLTDMDRLDPISIYIEDFERVEHTGSNRGKMTIECFGESWSAYWGGMGKSTVSEFVCRTNVGYLVNCFSRGIDSTVNAEDSDLHSALERLVCIQRRDSVITKVEARRLFNECSDVDDINGNSDIFETLIGCEWWTDFPQMGNHKYNYLARIVEAVQQGVKSNEVTK